MSILSVRKLVKVYRDRKVVNSVDLEVESGKVVGLLGPNGAGKTTTFYMTVGMVKPDEGHVFLDDTGNYRSAHVPESQKRIGLSAPGGIYFSQTNRQTECDGHPGIHGPSKAEREERADMLLDELGIKRLSQQKASVLSGGKGAGLK